MSPSEACLRPLRHHVRQMPTASTRFRLISGNRLDRLAGLLGERLASPLDVDSLAADVILIPQPTLRHWLQQTLAEQNGIAANLDTGHIGQLP